MKNGSKVEGRRSKVIRPLPLLCTALYLAASYSAAASRPAAEQARIDWLLVEIRNSKATFIRNGNEYDAAKAVSHLKTKLLFAGRRVQTARQFIVGVASHSEESGKPYEIREPDGRQVPMESWLLERLAVFEKGARSQRPPVLPPPAPTPSPPAKRKGVMEIRRAPVVWRTVQGIAAAAAISTGC